MSKSLYCHQRDRRVPDEKKEHYEEDSIEHEFDTSGEFSARQGVGGITSLGLLSSRADGHVFEVSNNEFDSAEREHNDDD